jgi:PPP family 3-phenylpropionic acid transporter
MRDLRIQYALTFAMLGTVLPYVSVYFRHAGLTPQQVGYAWAIWCAAIVLSPVFATMLADARVDPRRLLAASSAVAGVCLVALGRVSGLGPVLGVWCVYCLSSMPILPLLDGIHFSQQRRRQARGEPARAYPYVRVWGTIGYMVPTVLLLLLPRASQNLNVVLLIGGAFGFLTAGQALRLDDPRAARATDDADRRIPTADAARVLLRPNLIVFVAALLLLNMAGVAHSSFYPIYLTEHVGIDERWIGHISNLSVFIEMFFVVGCAALMRRLGVKRLLVIGMTAAVARLGLLAMSESVWVAVGTQFFHGLMLIATGVVPPMVLNEAAEDRFRHSMQGLYVMINGAGRMIANVAAGPVAAWSLSGLFGIAAGVSALAAVIILIAFREPRHEETVVEEAPPGPVEGLPTEAA